MRIFVLIIGAYLTQSVCAQVMVYKDTTKQDLAPGYISTNYFLISSKQVVILKLGYDGDWSVIPVSERTNNFVRLRFKKPELVTKGVNDSLVLINKEEYPVNVGYYVPNGAEESGMIEHVELENGESFKIKKPNSDSLRIRFGEMTCFTLIEELKHKDSISLINRDFKFLCDYDYLFSYLLAKQKLGLFNIKKEFKFCFNEDQRLVALPLSELRSNISLSSTLKWRLESLKSLSLTIPDAEIDSFIAALEKH